jgi:GGDEF domain-containing protein
MASEPHGYSRDPQTGLIGAGAAREMLEQWRAEAGEGEAAPVHALLVGLGRFDMVNLAYGEAAGDGALA